MATEEIGEIIFSQILRMSQYPGSPFTGNIVNDIIMFLFVPSVFIILFTYSILGRLFASGQTKLRLLVGITIYLFIIAGGYYSTFALLAGPYFLVLIFVLGVIFFVFGHFGVRRGHTMPGAALGNRSEMNFQYTMTELNAHIAEARQRLEEAQKLGSRDAPIWAEQLQKLEDDKERLKRDHTNPHKYR